MIYDDIIQRTPEWYAIKLGKVSASRVVDIMLGVKGRYLASREDYKIELVYEILKGKQEEENFISDDMQHGIDYENEARAAYEAKTGNFVDEVGFITHDTIDNFGDSPDGLVGKDGGIEIKCPKGKNHIKIILTGKVKRDYIFQMNTLMMCDNRKWCDYVSYDPDAPDYLQLFIKRFYRDEVMITEITQEVLLFNAELQAMIKQLEELK